MRIQVRRTGGFAGIEHHAEVDTSGRADAQEWHALAEEAASGGRRTPPIGVPDGFSYQVTIDDSTFYCSDPRLSESQRKLISRVLKEGA
ncbi:protealysin inhibitor emfourin [Streptomyces sp. NPDC004647]|uniref:protealysin inhibitor emfourin n=1 Tax=Streptomyces sp. NPDC004647 TaxID=3154671 RepID=UPI0033AFA2EB